MIRSLVSAGLLIMASASCLPAGAAPAAEDVDHQQEYEACMKLARERPEDGYRSGVAWFSQGGGFAARHCIAVSLLELGQYDEAAARLERLVTDLGTAPTELLVGILSQAGQAWYLAGRADKALKLQSNLVEIAPGNPEIWLDRAVTLMELKQYHDALSDIDAALRLDSDLLQARIYRAVVLRELDDLDGAWAEIATVLTLDPQRPGALLERGILRQYQGDLDGAREDWLAVIRIDPKSDTAEAARTRIEEMDLVAR